MSKHPQSTSPIRLLLNHSRRNAVKLAERMHADQCGLQQLELAIDP